MAVLLRVAYRNHAELRDAAAEGGLVVPGDDAAGLAFDAPVDLELTLPDGTALRGSGRVLQVLAGRGVAVLLDEALIEAAKAAAPPRPAPARGPKSYDELTNAEKIQKALHGTRDERNAILRDTNRSLHAYVLKNPQIDTEDVTAIAKNAQIGPDVLKLVAERKEWFTRPAIALALARNPKTPADIAVRALDHVPIDALRAMAKGTGVLPHVAMAARKKVIGGK